MNDHGKAATAKTDLNLTATDGGVSLPFGQPGLRIREKRQIELTQKRDYLSLIQTRRALVSTTLHNKIK